MSSAAGARHRRVFALPSAAVEQGIGGRIGAFSGGLGPMELWKASLAIAELGSVGAAGVVLSFPLELASTKEGAEYARALLARGKSKPFVLSALKRFWRTGEATLEDEPPADDDGTAAPSEAMARAGRTPGARTLQGAARDFVGSRQLVH